MTEPLERRGSGWVIRNRAWTAVKQAGIRNGTFGSRVAPPASEPSGFYPGWTVEEMARSRLPRVTRVR